MISTRLARAIPSEPLGTMRGRSPGPSGRGFVRKSPARADTPRGHGQPDREADDGYRHTLPEWLGQDEAWRLGHASRLGAVYSPKVHAAQPTAGPTPTPSVYVEPSQSRLIEHSMATGAQAGSAQPTRAAT